MARPRRRSTPGPDGRVPSRSKYARAVPQDCFEALSRRRIGQPNDGDSDLLRRCREEYGYGGRRRKAKPDDDSLPLFESPIALALARIAERRERRRPQPGRAIAEARSRIDARKPPPPSSVEQARANLAQPSPSESPPPPQSPDRIPGASPRNEHFKDVAMPKAHDVGSRTPREIAARLPVWKNRDPGHGALIVNGKLYLIKTSDRDGKEGYSSDLVPPGAVKWELGFTPSNNKHLEAQGAAVIRKIALEGGEVQEATLVTNRPFVCIQDGEGCQGRRQLTC